MSHPKIRLGTRGSALARWQADWVTEELAKLGVAVEQIVITTQGDTKTAPIGTLGSQGLFTKEIQRALLEEEIDLAVHSLKDLPTEEVEGLILAAVPQRASTNDALVSKQYGSLDELPENARVGTGSLRRSSQLRHYRADLQILDIRGNVDTRLRKLDDGDYEAIVLAEAGLTRLGLQDRITEIVSEQIMLPAVGQGALGLETRREDEVTRKVLQPLDDMYTHSCVVAERSLLAALRGGCLAPVGAVARLSDDQLHLVGTVLSSQGEQRVDAEATGGLEFAESLGDQVAEALFDQGAAELIATSRQA